MVCQQILFTQNVTALNIKEKQKLKSGSVSGIIAQFPDGQQNDSCKGLEEHMPHIFFFPLECKFPICSQNQRFLESNFGPKANCQAEQGIPFVLAILDLLTDLSATFHLLFSYKSRA